MNNQLNHIKEIYRDSHIRPSNAQRPTYRSIFSIKQQHFPDNISMEFFGVATNKRVGALVKQNITSRRHVWINGCLGMEDTWVGEEGGGLRLRAWDERAQLWIMNVDAV